jgi:phosphonate transport system permease protein
MTDTKNKVTNDRPLTIEEAYASRPRLWWVYTLIVLIVAALLGWSGTSITYKGLATKGMTIAQGVGNGLIHPDTGLLFNLTPEGVPYQLLQTVAIAVLGTIIGGILAIPFSFLACDKIVPKWLAVIFRAVILVYKRTSVNLDAAIHCRHCVKRGRFHAHQFIAVVDKISEYLNINIYADVR